jgi:hypothetical protein
MTNDLLTKHDLDTFANELIAWLSVMLFADAIVVVGLSLTLDQLLRSVTILQYLQQ